MKKTVINLSLILLVVLIMGLSIWGPEAYSRYRDKNILDEIHISEADGEGEGYRYALGRGDRLYILAEALNSRTLPETEQYAVTKGAAASGNYQEPAGNYAFIVNHRGPSEREITAEEIYETCSGGLETLKGLGILPDSVKEVDSASYDAVLYSAIDVLEPRNNVAVWNLSLSNIQKNMDRGNRMIDAFIDADDGKIYEIYVRTPLSWEEIDPDEIIGTWSEYLGLEKPAVYEVENPLLETTPYFKKYVFPGMGEGKTIVTVGFYEGINELFIKISK